MSMELDCLDAIKARYEAATPGEWVVDHVQGSVCVLSASGVVMPWQDINSGHSFIRPEANAALVAHARTDLPRLEAAMRVMLPKITRMSKLQCKQDGSIRAWSMGCTCDPCSARRSMAILRGEVES